MNLRRWDVVFVSADEKDAVGHPGVILSHEDLLDDPRFLRINVVMGSKKNPAQIPASRQVLLNGADGLDFLTTIDCDFVAVARKNAILRRVGMVSLERRREIARKVRAFLGLG